MSRFLIATLLLIGSLLPTKADVFGFPGGGGTGSGGTVTSIGINNGDVFTTITNSPVTTTGDITVSFNEEYFLQNGNNLSELSNTTTARTNLGVAIGTDVQAYSAALTTLSGNDGSALTSIPTSAITTGTFADARISSTSIQQHQGDLLITESQITDLVHTTDTTLSQEQVEDYAGALFTTNSETRITSTYNDTTGKVDLVVDNDLANYDNTNSAFLTAEVDGSTTNEIQNLFETISVPSGTNPVADSSTDTLSLLAGTGITIVGAAASDTITIASTVTDTTLTQEQVEDYAGAMVSGNTETGITVTYQDADGTIDYEVTDSYVNTTGDTVTGDVTFNDNVNITLGTGGDADIDYDGTDLIINPRVVGSGVVDIVGDLEVDETAYNDALVDAGSSGTSKTIDWGTGNRHKITMTGNCTFTFTAPPGVASLVLIATQDGTGSRTATWPASVKWPSGTAPTLTSTASAVDIFSCLYDGVSVYYCQFGLNFQ